MLYVSYEVMHRSLMRMLYVKLSESANNLILVRLQQDEDSWHHANNLSSSVAKYTTIAQKGERQRNYSHPI